MKVKRRRKRRSPVWTPRLEALWRESPPSGPTVSRAEGKVGHLPIAWPETKGFSMPSNLWIWVLAGLTLLTLLVGLLLQRTGYEERLFRRLFLGNALPRSAWFSWTAPIIPLMVGGQVAAARFGRFGTHQLLWSSFPLSLWLVAYGRMGWLGWGDLTVPLLAWMLFLTGRLISRSTLPPEGERIMRMAGTLAFVGVVLVYAAQPEAAWKQALAVGGGTALALFLARTEPSFLLRSPKGLAGGILALLGVTITLLGHLEPDRLYVRVGPFTLAPMEVARKAVVPAAAVALMPGVPGIMRGLTGILVLLVLGMGLWLREAGTVLVMVGTLAVMVFPYREGVLRRVRSAPRAVILGPAAFVIVMFLGFHGHPTLHALATRAVARFKTFVRPEVNPEYRRVLAAVRRTPMFAPPGQAALEAVAGSRTVKDYAAAALALSFGWTVLVPVVAGVTCIGGDLLRWGMCMGEPLRKAVVVGFGADFLIGSWTNLLASLGGFPPVGIPIPLVSQGANAALMQFAALGLAVALGRTRNGGPA